MTKDTIEVPPGTPVYLICWAGGFSYSEAVMRSAREVSVHKQHKNGKLVLAAGREATKYGPTYKPFRDSTFDGVCDWAACEIGGFRRSDTLIPITASTTLWVEGQRDILAAEKEAREASDLIQSHMKRLGYGASSSGDLKSAEKILAEAVARITGEARA